MKNDFLLHKDLKCLVLKYLDFIFYYSLVDRGKKIILSLILVGLLLISRHSISFLGPVANILYSIIWYVVLPFQVVYIVNERFLYTEADRKLTILCLLVWMILESFFSPLSFINPIISFLFGWTYKLGFNPLVIESIVVYVANLSILGTVYYRIVSYF